jgi:hypothetical protein
MQFFKPGINKHTMNNFTCNILKHQALWSFTAMITSAPVYPASTRGSEDNQRGSPGTR